MDYTKNHHLPQWVKSDRIMMDDFNEAMSNIESGLTTAVGKADSAQSTANAAQSAANAASRKQYAVGTYTGTGADLTINLGFRPSFLIISGLKEAGRMDSVSSFGVYGCATSGAGPVSTCVTLTGSGFSVRSSTTYPHLSESGRVYEYIAFK